MNAFRRIAYALLTAGMCSLASGQEATQLRKTPVDQFLAPACQQIEASAGRFPRQEITRATQYFTPLFPPNQHGWLREEDRRACLNIEGSCIVGNHLYNYPDRLYNRAEVVFKFGMGSGKNDYNTTNALDPCPTLAADKRSYPTGAVIYIPYMRDKVCPQTGKTVDGCFIVGDVGSAIRGQGRFDFFTGECANYSKRTNTCRDPGNSRFVAPQGTQFHVIERSHPLAVGLRSEVDAFIRRGWKVQ